MGYGTVVGSWEGVVDGCRLRVERGHANAEELAAVTVVLLALCAARDTDGALARRGRRGLLGAASWRRPERVSAYQAPHSWK